MANDYPRMLYHEDGRTLTVASVEHEETARSVGFGQQPFDVHRKVRSNVPENSLAKTPAQGSTPDDPFGLLAFGDLLIARMRVEIVNEVADLVVAKLRAEFVPPDVAGSDEPASEMSADVDASADKPRRGRPPKDRSALSSFEQDHSNG